MPLKRLRRAPPSLADAESFPSPPQRAHSMQPPQPCIPPTPMYTHAPRCTQCTLPTPLMPLPCPPMHLPCAHPMPLPCTLTSNRIEPAPSLPQRPRPELELALPLTRCSMTCPSSTGAVGGSQTRRRRRPRRRTRSKGYQRRMQLRPRRPRRRRTLRVSAHSSSSASPPRSAPPSSRT